MSTIHTFEIDKLHGYKDIELTFENNTLVLVGENGAGKTTILRLLFYLLTGQIQAMTKYNFEALTIGIDSNSYSISRKAIEKYLQNIELISHLPPSIRYRVTSVMENPTANMEDELKSISEKYGFSQLYLADTMQIDAANTDILEKIKSIKRAFKSQILYLPTYRRIEQELRSIFKNIDESAFEPGHSMQEEKENTYVELVEFGMKDVESAINRIRLELDRFARVSLNKLTFSYLGDIVESKYESVKLEQIKSAEDKSIDNILSRVPSGLLSSQNKGVLKNIIANVKASGTLGEHEKVICHYFTRLMEFHNQLETKEAKIVNFCRVCNSYMRDKEFIYDKFNFAFKIKSQDDRNSGKNIDLQSLSSGEKQIASIFSHLYLSGGKNYFVMIDEPELSLSVEWQKKFLLDIDNAAFCSGLVAVTHSPFIYDNELHKYARGLGEFVL